MNNQDGSPMTDEQKSSEVKSNKSAMNSIANVMSRAKSSYSKGTDLLNSYKTARQSLSSDPFALDKNAKDLRIVHTMNSMKSLQQSMLRSASNTAMMYSKLKSRNDVLINGTIGEQIAKSDSEEREAQSSQAMQVRIQNDPQFSLSISASQSTSASLAKLDPATRNSMLNSMANEQLNGANYGTNDPSQLLTPSERDYMLKPSNIKNRGNK